MICRFGLAVALGYLLGSIPFGFLATRRTKGVDVRDYGSGKIGTTNVIRTGGPVVGVVTLGADLAKGALAVFLGGIILGDITGNVGGMVVDGQDAEVASGIAAIAGHVWPIYIGFRGGRGVATFIGGLLALHWPTALICGAGITLGVAFTTRYFSLGSLIGALSSVAIMALLVWVWNQPVEYLIYATVGAAIIIWQHRDNIKRLREGKERKIGEKAEFRR
jgi:glycerol-3-phosphate acyltransferase PlsY